MFETLVALVLDESKWLTFAMLVAGLAVAPHARALLRERARREVVRAMHLFYGWMIGLMAAGHLLAVALEWARGTLEGELLLLVPLGLVLAVPAGWLVAGAGRLAEDDARGRRTLTALDVFLGVALLALGPHNWPLAAPAAGNLAYLFATRRALAWTSVSLTVALYAALLVGALVFLATGQSFEQFQEMTP